MKPAFLRTYFSISELYGKPAGQQNGIHFAFQYHRHFANHFSNLVKKRFLDEPGFFIAGFGHFFHFLRIIGSQVTYKSSFANNHSFHLTPGKFPAKTNIDQLSGRQCT